jgi:hypothetical protein
LSAAAVEAVRVEGRVEVVRQGVAASEVAKARAAAEVRAVAAMRAVREAAVAAAAAAEWAEWVEVVRLSAAR